MSTDDSLPEDVETLKQLLLARDAELVQVRADAVNARAEAVSACAEAANARAEASSAEVLITHLRLEIEKLKRDLFGARNERKARLVDQMELQLEELEAAATEDELAAAKAAATTPVRAFTRRKPARKPFPAHLPRERVVVPGPTTCGCCGSSRLAKLGEDVTETLEAVPRQWKVVQTVREKFTCRGSARRRRRSRCCRVALPDRACSPSSYSVALSHGTPKSRRRRRTLPAHPS